jgi:hypothetical protein
MKKLLLIGAALGGLVSTAHAVERASAANTMPTKLRGTWCQVGIWNELPEFSVFERRRCGKAVHEPNRQITIETTNIHEQENNTPYCAAREVGVNKEGNFWQVQTSCVTRGTQAQGEGYKLNWEFILENGRLMVKHD